MYHVKLSNGDNAFAEDLPAAVRTAEQLARDASVTGAARSQLRVTILNPDDVCVLADVHPEQVRGWVCEQMKRQLDRVRR